MTFKVSQIKMLANKKGSATEEILGDKTRTYAYMCYWSFLGGTAVYFCVGTQEGPCQTLREWIYTPKKALVR